MYIIHIYIHIYSEILLSYEKHELLPISATWIDLEFILSVVDQQRKISLICMWKPNKIQINLFIKHKQTHRHRK